MLQTGWGGGSQTLLEPLLTTKWPRAQFLPLTEAASPHCPHPELWGASSSSHTVNTEYMEKTKHFLGP